MNIQRDVTSSFEPDLTPYHGTYIKSIEETDIPSLKTIMFDGMENDKEGLRQYAAPHNFREWESNPAKFEDYIERLNFRPVERNLFVALEDHEIKGLVGVPTHEDDDSEGILKYWFTNRRRGRTGLATHAVSEAVNATFQRNAKVKRIVATPKTNNTRSINLLRRSQVNFRPLLPTDAPITWMDHDQTAFVMPKVEWKGI